MKDERGDGEDADSEAGPEVQGHGLAGDVLDLHEKVAE